MRNDSVFLLVLAILVAPVGCMPTQKAFPPPEPTSWTPQGPRVAVADVPAAPHPAAFSYTVHMDTLCSDEIGLAFPPVFEFEWVAEEYAFVPEGPSFDGEGNIYFTPLWSEEELLLVCLDPETGARKWVVPGTSDGCGAPLVLANETAKDGTAYTIFVSSYDHAMAVAQDGTVLWDMPTGLPSLDDMVRGVSTHCFGMNYVPQWDAVVALMGDGHLVAMRREDGELLTNAPFEFPGAISEPVELPPVPEPVLKRIDELLLAFIPKAPPLIQEDPTYQVLQVLLGGDAKTANFFSVDPNTGRMFVAGTAPDEVDCVDAGVGDCGPDGISEYGALYVADLVDSGKGDLVVELAGHYYFEGGSGSTPALRADGQRVYFGDSVGNLICLDRDCNPVWAIDTGEQIFGSVAVASDNHEIYASNIYDIVKVVDHGPCAEIAWRSQIDAYDTRPGMLEFNLLLAAVGANGLMMQAGAGPMLEEPQDEEAKLSLSRMVRDVPLPMKLGVGLVDRQTGKLRYFAEGLEESISVVCIGPDGGVYLGHSPIRRAIALALYGDFLPPLVGGIGKYAVRRPDLLVREAVCAAADRAWNAYTCRSETASAEADICQIKLLIKQARERNPWGAGAEPWLTVEGHLNAAETYLSVQTLDKAAYRLQQACGAIAGQAPDCDCPGAEKCKPT